MRALIRSNPIALVALSLIVLASLGAPWAGAHDPWDPSAVDLADALRPPAWWADGDRRFLFGTDALGRDLVGLTLHGLRLSLVVGLGATALAVAVGVAVGLVAAVGGAVLDAVLMRATDAQLTFPPLVAALLVDAVLVAVTPTEGRFLVALAGVTMAVGWSQWAPIARVVRAAALVEAQQDYVTAARACGATSARVVASHLAPNVAPVVIALAATGVGYAVLAEATLSFIGLGLPADAPSLGTLIRQGADHVFAGRWWLVAVPGGLLTGLVMTLGALGPTQSARH